MQPFAFIPSTSDLRKRLIRDRRDSPLLPSPTIASLVSSGVILLNASEFEKSQGVTQWFLEMQIVVLSCEAADLTRAYATGYGVESAGVDGSGVKHRYEIDQPSRRRKMPFARKIKCVFDDTIFLWL